MKINKLHILVAGVAIVIFGCAFEFVLYVLHADLITKVTGGTTVVLLGMLIALCLEIANLSQEHQTKILEALEPHCFVKIRTEIAEYGSISKFANDQINIIENCIEPIPHGFKLKGDVLSPVSYVDFWKFLQKEQEKRSTTPHLALKANAIHSCSLAIWLDHSLTERLYMHQKAFIKAGGRIKRVLCSKGTIPNEEVKGACNRMQALQIDVWYYNINKNLTTYDFTTDFVIVEGLNTVVKWTGFSNANQMFSEIQYLNQIEEHIQDTWDTISSPGAAEEFSKGCGTLCPKSDEN